MTGDPAGVPVRAGTESDLDRIRFALAAATQLAQHLEQSALIDEITLTPDGVVTVLFVSATDAARIAYTLGLRGPIPVTDEGRALRWSGTWADAEVTLEGLGRPRTPQYRTTSTAFPVRPQLVCNGCGQCLGDAYPDEQVAVRHPELGALVARYVPDRPDIRTQCPWCVTEHGPTGVPS